MIQLIGLFPYVEICREQERIRKNPGDRTCHAHPCKSKYRNQEDRGRDSPDHLKDTCKNCQHRISHSLNQKAHDVHKGQRNVKYGADDKRQSCGIQNFSLRAADEQGRKRPSIEKHNHKYRQRINGTDNRSTLQPLVQPSKLLRADVLSSVGCHRRAERIIHRAEEAGNASRCRLCRNIDGSQPIDCRSQHDTADCSDGILQSHRDSHYKKDPDIIAVKLPLLLPDPEDLHLLNHINYSKDSGRSL